jgi:hypothetical protein
MLKHAFLSKTERSYIDVILKDGTYHHFTPRVLNVLLESRRVHKFKRTSGWATVGVDAVRTSKMECNDGGYYGPNRRMVTH